MNKEESPRLSYLTINAIVWAAILLTGSYFFEKDIHYNMMLGGAVVAYSISNALIYNYMKKHGLLDKEDCKSSQWNS